MSHSLQPVRIGPMVAGRMDCFHAKSLAEKPAVAQASTDLRAMQDARNARDIAPARIASVKPGKPVKPGGQ